MLENIYLEGQYLSLDFGTKKIGIAIGQTITKGVTPLAVLAIKNHQLPFSQIDEYIKQWMPRAIIVGMPFHEDGTQSETGEMTQKFCNLLQRRYDLPIYTQNEHLSSFEARLMMSASKKTKLGVDAFAAAVILKAWFDQNF